jgi:hypothetical protein
MTQAALPAAGSRSGADTVSEDSPAYRLLQPHALTNQYAAFPSLHVGWDLLIGLALFTAARRWWLRALAVLAPLLMCAAVVVTANHYLLDVLAGATIATSAWAVTARSRGPVDRVGPAAAGASAGETLVGEAAAERPDAAGGLDLLAADRELVHRGVAPAVRLGALHGAVTVPDERPVTVQQQLRAPPASGHGLLPSPLWSAPVPERTRTPERLSCSPRSTRSPHRRSRIPQGASWFRR